MKRGYLDRREDVSGYSGTGQVSEFAISSDGRIANFWPTGVQFFNSLEDMMKVHGHDGKTIAVILDDEVAEIEHCNGCHNVMASVSNAQCAKHDFGCPGCLAGVS